MLFKDNVVWWIIRNIYTHTHTHTVLAKYNALKRSRGGTKLPLCFKGMTAVYAYIDAPHLSLLICHSFTLDSRVSFQNGKITIISKDASSKITPHNFWTKWNFHPSIWAGTLVTLTLERGGGVPYPSASRQANMSLTHYLLPCTYSESNISSPHPPMIRGSLSPRHGASSGCGWRNGLQYGGNLWIYWISSRGQPIRGGRPVWGLGEVLTTPHRKTDLVWKRIRVSRTRTHPFARSK